MNVILLHGNSFHFSEEGFGPRLIEFLKKNQFDYIAPEMPVGNEVNFEGWKKILDEAGKQINNETIIIAHSLSGVYLPKFLKETEKKPYAVITIASGQKCLIDAIIPNSYRLFISTKKDFEYVRDNVQNRFAVYSNNDHKFTSSELINYAKSMEAKPLYLEGRGHFGRSSGVKEIPEVNALVLDLARNLATTKLSKTL